MCNSIFCLSCSVAAVAVGGAQYRIDVCSPPSSLLFFASQLGFTRLLQPNEAELESVECVSAKWGCKAQLKDRRVTCVSLCSRPGTEVGDLQ